MDRRAFVRTSAGAAASLGLAGVGCDPRARAAATARVEPMGLQLYTVRSLMASSVESTLAEVARIGYREVEFAGYFEHPLEEIRGMLDEVGLAAPAVHLPLSTFRESLDEALEAARVVGHRYLVLPSLPAAELSSAERVRALAAEMNRFGERCAEAEARFAFHNHDAELAPLNGEIPLRLLIEGTDPDLVTFEVDLFWLVHGGGDPLDYFEAYPGRFELCHVKDRTADGRMVDVGAGTIDFAAIFARSARAGLRHYFVEHDRPGDPLQSIRASYEHLAALPA